MFNFHTYAFIINKVILKFGLQFYAQLFGSKFYCSILDLLLVNTHCNRLKGPNYMCCRSYSVAGKWVFFFFEVYVKGMAPIFFLSPPTFVPVTIQVSTAPVCVIHSPSITAFVLVTNKMVVLQRTPMSLKIQNFPEARAGRGKGVRNRVSYEK